MSKRAGDIINSASSNIKIQRVYSKNKEVEQQILPDEMITMIISHLNENKDLKNCLFSSKYIQDLMLKAPEIMRKIKYTFESNTKIEEISEFLSEKGKYIRNIGIRNLADHDGFYHSIKINNQVLIPYIANQVPNLEDFSCESNFSWRVSDPNTYTILNPFYMPRLKHLSLCDHQLLYFITNARCIANLETLTFKNVTGYVEVVAKFLCEQENLKSLTFCENLTSFQFPDISKIVKFNLTKFEYLNHYREKSQNFINFLKRQAGSLEELNISGPINLELCEIILTKCRNLKKLTSYSFFSSSNLENVNSDWTLSNLTHFDGGTLKLNLAYAMFPNLISLICEELKNAVGTFDKLESLEVEFFNCCEIQNCKFPKLQNLSISTISEEYYWEQCAQNVPKLENFKLSQASNFSQFLFVLKSLKNLKNIKKFEIFNSYGENKILLNTAIKVIEISEIFLKDRQEIVNILRENFKNFSFKLNFEGENS